MDKRTSWEVIAGRWSMPCGVWLTDKVIGMWKGWPACGNNDEGKSNKLETWTKVVRLMRFPWAILAHESLEPDSSEKPEFLKDVPEVYHEFADVFSRQKADTLPPHRDCDLKINIDKGAKVPAGPIYPLSEFELKTLREFIDENLKTGFIRPSNSPFRAPVLFIKKKDGSLRLCVDFQRLNAITQKDKYPLPLTSKLLDTPSRAKVFTKIDLKHAYHLIQIAARNEWKTAFRTYYGSFEWLVMPFRLTNVPGGFQRFLNGIFSDLLDIYVIIYLDNILIFSGNKDNHFRQSP
jgi:Reverse transcriptase (RNA-dependent DNA polymerase)